VQALRNNPSNTVLTSIPALQAAVRANPELQGGTTVGGLIDYAKSEFDNDTITANDIARVAAESADRRRRGNRPAFHRTYPIAAIPPAPVSVLAAMANPLGISSRDASAAELLAPRQHR
jgi:hypothetical protein